ncbi:hypothetical protein BT67DRAFT_270394 [Trichocladium antarcticum]|uniref:Uncharacterized protein n=1 Tax=Trichocladium antarcticum TaxID=1450529 RepID=A0AAN6UMA1_9PEZI|nr:hypothetical protein BT67DRAFT_270394 [Trichocladium antarcticum]
MFIACGPAAGRGTDRGAGNSTGEEDAVPASFSPKPGEPTADGVALCGSPAWPGNAEATMVVRAARLKLGAWSFASLAIRCRRLACPCKRRRLLVPSLGFHAFQSPKAPPHGSAYPGSPDAAAPHSVHACSRQPRICTPPPPPLIPTPAIIRAFPSACPLATRAVRLCKK